MDQAVQEHYTAALTPATHKTYKAAEQKYLTFCVNFSLSPISTSENILCYFAACLGQEGLASSTIRTYLSGIRQIQIAAGFPNLLIDHMPRLRQVLKDIRVQAVRIGSHPRPHLPITPSILCKLRRVWLEGNPTFNNTMLWVASTTTFFGFCTSREITVQCESKFDPQTHLCFSDVAVDNALHPSTISIMLKYSKTNQFRKGVKLVMGRTNDDLCPVTHSIAIIPISSWQCSWSSLPLGQSHTSIKAKICRTCSSCTASSQRTSISLHRTQFPHWSSNNSILSWHRGLYHSNLGTLEKLSLPPLHQAEPLSSGMFVHYNGSVPHLTITGMSGYLIVCTNYYYVTLILNHVTLILTNLQPNCNSCCLSGCKWLP